MKHDILTKVPSDKANASNSIVRRLIKSGRFFRFVGVGGSVALAYIATATLFVKLDVTPWLASGVAYIVFIPVAYILQKNYTFESDAYHRHSFPRYSCAGAR